MKRNLLTGFATAAAGCALLVSCGSPFSKVQIKAEPELYAPLGSKNFEMSSYVSVEKIRDMLNSGEQNEAASKLKVYEYDDYDDGSGTMAFRLYYPLMDLDLDFSSYMDKLDMTELGSAIPAVAFTVPVLDGLEIATQTVSVPGTAGYGGQTLTPETAEFVNKVLQESGSSLTIEDRKVNVAGEGLKAVTFASTGNTITMTLTPTVEGITCTPDIAITLPDGKETVKFENGISNPKGGITYTADFGGKTISPGDLVFSGAVSLSGSVSAGTEIPDEGIGVTVEVAVNLNGGFESATMDVPEGVELTKTVSYDLPEEVTKMVQKISFPEKGLGIVLNMDTSLPSGNDFRVTMNAFGGIIDKTQHVTTGQDGNARQSLEFLNVSVAKITPATTPTLSAELAITPPGYNSTDNTMTIKNVTPGETYGLSGTVTVKADWDAITVSSDKYTGVFPADGAEPVDLSGFTDKLPEGINLSGIGADLFVSSPLAGTDSGMTFLGTVTLSGTDAEGQPVTASLVGTKDAPETLKLADAVTLPAEGADAWNKQLPKSTASVGEKVTSFLNSRPESFSLAYSLQADSVTISKNDIENSGGKTSAKAELVITLPLMLKIDGSGDGEDGGVLEIDVFEMAGIAGTEDLFNRTEPSATNDTVNKLLDQLTNMTIDVAYNNKLGIEAAARLVIIAAEDGTPELECTFTLEKGAGTQSVTLNRDDIKRIMETYPFCPRVYVDLPDGDLTLQKDGGIDVSLAVTAVTDVDYTYNLKGEN